MGFHFGYNKNFHGHTLFMAIRQQLWDVHSDGNGKIHPKWQVSPVGNAPQANPAWSQIAPVTVAWAKLRDATEADFLQE